MTPASLGVFVGGRFIGAAHFFVWIRIVLLRFGRPHRDRPPCRSSFPGNDNNPLTASTLELYAISVLPG